MGLALTGSPFNMFVSPAKAMKIPCSNNYIGRKTGDSDVAYYLITRCAP